MKNIRAAYALFMTQSRTELAYGFATIFGLFALIGAAWIALPN